MSRLFISYLLALCYFSACDCHRLGSIRADCEQMTGRCVCRANVVGLKCDRCHDGQLVDKVPGGCGGYGGSGGTGSGSDDALESESRHCSDLTCRFGAICQDLQGQAVCVCPMDCPVASSAEQTVCGSDGVSYGSECDLRLAACRKQLNVVMAYEGPCSDDIINTSAGMSPLVAESETAVSKATRHVQETDVALLDWGRRDIVSLSQVGSQKANEYYGFSQPVWRPTASSVHVRGFLGESCTDDSQCKSVANSGCLFGVCGCSDGFAEDSDRKSCVGMLCVHLFLLSCQRLTSLCSLKRSKYCVNFGIRRIRTGQVVILQLVPLFGRWDLPTTWHGIICLSLPS